MKRIARFGEDHENKMKQLQDIFSKLDEHLAATGENKELRHRQLELQQEKREEAKLLYHLSILEKKPYEDKDAEMVEEAKNKSRSRISKFLKK